LPPNRPRSHLEQVLCGGVDSASRAGNSHVHEGCVDQTAITASGGVTGSAARDDVGVGIVAGIFHVERREDVFLQELLVALAADLFNQIAEEDVTRVAVVELRAGFEIERLIAEAGDGFPGGGRQGLCGYVVREAGEVRDAGRVREDVIDRDLVPGSGSVRHVFLSGIVDFEFAALFEQEYRGGGELFG
jgi:hypothetical protein